MKDFTLIKFTFTDQFYGYPEPFIPTVSRVILIQDGQVSISKYQEPTIDDPYQSFIHTDLSNLKNKEIE